jgi:hypothetical protein
MRATKGSKKWLQKLINEKPHLLDLKIKKELNLPEDERIHWLSPLKENGYLEYGDQHFIEKLGIKLEKFPLEDFWPSRGPQWDALAKSQRGNLFLVEAKSHIRELISTMKAKDEGSVKKIRKSLQETKCFLNSNIETDWSHGFYQYTNRLAHLYLLREKNQLPAYLVFIYFINDVEMNGAKTINEWKSALKLLHSFLGIGGHKLQNFTADIFIDVSCLQ